MKQIKYLLLFLITSILMIGGTKAATATIVDDDYEISYADSKNYAFVKGVEGDGTVNKWSIHGPLPTGWTTSVIDNPGSQYEDPNKEFRVTIPNSAKSENAVIVFKGSSNIIGVDGKRYDIQIRFTNFQYTTSTEPASIAIKSSAKAEDTIGFSTLYIYGYTAEWALYEPGTNNMINKPTAYIFENGIDDEYSYNPEYDGYGLWRAEEYMKIKADNNYKIYKGKRYVGGLRNAIFEDNAIPSISSPCSRASAGQDTGTGYCIGGKDNIHQIMILDRRVITTNSTKLGEQLWRKIWVNENGTDVLRNEDGVQANALGLGIGFFVPKITTPNPTKAVSQNDITNVVKEDGTYKYTIKQEVPWEVEEYRYSSFKMSDTLEKVLTSTNVKVYQDSPTGTDVTGWFDIQTGQTATATLKSGNNVEAFYGHTYYFVIDAKVRSNLDDDAVSSYRKGTVYEVPNEAKILIGGENERKTNVVNVYWYRGMCPGGDCSDDPDGPEPELQPTKTVSSKYINDTTSFDYRVTQYVPGYNAGYLWTELTLTDTIDKAFDINKTTVKVISSRFGENRDFCGEYFDCTVDKATHKITAKAKAAALTTENFYGPQNTDPKKDGTRYTMVITTQVTEGFKFTGYEQRKECRTVDTRTAPEEKTEQQEVKDENGECDIIYTVINNKASRTFKEHNNTYNGITPEVPTTQVNPKLPTKEVDTYMIRPEHEFNYTISAEVQPAGYQKSNGTATQTENAKVYFDKWVFTDVLEPPLQIKDDSKVKITQVNAEGQEKDYTDKFDIKIEGNKVTATLKNPKDADFYGTRGTNDVEIPKTYKFKLTVSLRDNAENIMDMSKYIAEDGVSYEIPNKGTITSQIPGNKEVSRDTNNVNVYYYPEAEPVKAASEDNITELYKQDKEYKYTITKDVLAYDKNIYYNSYVFEDVLEDVLEAKKDSLVIKNEAGIVVTSWFDVKVEGQKITATLKEPKKARFYGHTYKYEITTKVKKGANLEKYRQGNQYIIPNEATFIIDNKVKIKTNKKEVYINIEPAKEEVVKVPKTLAGIPLYAVATGTILLLLSLASLIYINHAKKKFIK